MPLKRAVTEFGKTYKDRFALRTYPCTSVPIFILLLGFFPLSSASHCQHKRWLCALYVGPFANDYPEGKLMSALKGYPSQYPCNMCWCDKNKVSHVLHGAWQMHVCNLHLPRQMHVLLCICHGKYNFQLAFAMYNLCVKLYVPWQIQFSIGICHVQFMRAMVVR